jgi:hypothetical protein
MTSIKNSDFSEESKIVTRVYNAADVIDSDRTCGM